jgi:hypothetical protein
LGSVSRLRSMLGSIDFTAFLRPVFCIALN